MGTSMQKSNTRGILRTILHRVMKPFVGGIQSRNPRKKNDQKKKRNKKKEENNSNSEK